MALYARLWARKMLDEQWNDLHENMIKKPTLQRLILDKSPRLSYEPMQTGARYRTIYNYVFLDKERLDGFVVCKLCQKPITVPRFGISGVKQHYHHHLIKGECPMYDNLTKTWNGLIDMRSALHQETMQKFVVPIKLPPEAYIAMQHFHPVQLFMEISKEVNFDQCPDDGAIPAKKAKTSEETPFVSSLKQFAYKPRVHGEENLPTPFNVVSLDDTLPLPHDYLFPPSPPSPLPPLVICESSTSTTTSSQ